MSFLFSLFGGDSSSSSRKRIRADEYDDEDEAFVKPAMDGWSEGAKQRHVGEAADVAASRAVEEAAAEAEAAEAEAIDAQARATEEAAAAAAVAAANAVSRSQFNRRVSSVLLQSRRAMKTVELIRSISLPTYSVSPRHQVRALRAALLADAPRRPDQSLLDPNFQDADGKTIIMHIIDLCAKVKLADKLSYMDTDTVRGQLKSLLSRTDARLTNNKGEAALNYLAKKIQVNDQDDLIWWLTSNLVGLASAAGMLESRDAGGFTPFLRWCQTVRTPHVLQLLIDAGCDVTASDKNGNNGIHKLARRYEDNTLEALSTAKRSFVVQPWCVPNHFGDTPLELADSQLQTLLEPASKVWTDTVVPLLTEQIGLVLNGGRDVTRICVEYLDGSGPPFVAEEEEGDDEDGDSSDSSIQPLTPLAELDQLMDEAAQEEQDANAIAVMHDDLQIPDLHMSPLVDTPISSSSDSLDSDSDQEARSRKISNRN